MNSQFKNSNLGFVIYAALIGIIAAATFFMIWYMIWGYKIGTYAPETRLGSVYIGGLRENEIFGRVDEKVDEWYLDEYVVFEVTYQDYQIPIDRDIILFSLNTDLYSIENGQTNELLVSIQYSDQEVLKNTILEKEYIQDLIDGDESNIDLQKLINDLLDDAALMKAYSSLDIEDYIVDQEKAIEVIQSKEVTLPQGLTFVNLDTKIKNVFEDGKILIPEKELFDVVSVFGSELTNVEMNVLSNAMLDLIQETNFLINEVHYNTEIDSRYTLDNYPYYGANTTIDGTNDISFSFYNPNESLYYFELLDVDGTYELVLKGLPFAYEITIRQEETEIPFIEQTTTKPTLVNETGRNGMIIEVYRTITDVYGEVVSEELIIYEFYHPIKKITLE